MAQPRDDRQKELFRPALEQIIDIGHPLVRMAGRSRSGIRMGCRAPEWSGTRSSRDGGEGAVS